MGKPDFNPRKFSELVDEVGGLEESIKDAYRTLRAAEDGDKLRVVKVPSQQLKEAEHDLNNVIWHYENAPSKIREYLKEHKLVLNVEYVRGQNNYEVILRCPSLECDLETLESIRAAVQFSRLYVQEKIHKRNGNNVRSHKLIDDAIEYHMLYSAIAGDNFGPSIGARGDMHIHIIEPPLATESEKLEDSYHLQILGYKFSPLGSKGFDSTRETFGKIKKEGLMDINISLDIKDKK